MEARRDLRRQDGTEAGDRVSTVELFFDLVFVFAVTQLSHGLIAHLTWTGVLETAILLFAVWWFWNYTVWATNWLNADTQPVRWMLISLMLVSLLMSTSIPEAFGDRALMFALAYTVMQIARCAFVVIALRHHNRPVSITMLRAGLWFVASAPFWIIGAVDRDNQVAWWLLAIVIEFIAPLLRYRLPVLGAASYESIRVSGHHMAERSSLFVIIALGESILATGTGFSEGDFEVATVLAFLGAFIGTILLWLLYFRRSAEKNAESLSHSANSGRLARLSFTYLLVILVAGIVVVAVGDELVLHHPLGHLEASTALIVTGGPALYLAGSLFFKRSIGYHWLASHILAIVALAITLIACLALHPEWMTPLALTWVTNAILLGVVIADEFGHRRHEKSAVAAGRTLIS